MVESFLVHEDIVITLAVKELVGAAFHTYVFEFLADIEAAFEHTAVYHVFQLGTHESVALARFHV